MLLVVGSRDRTGARDANSIFASLQRTRPKVPKDLSLNERLKQSSLNLETRNTALKGTKLLIDSLNTDQLIGKFIRYRVDDSDYPWTNRSKQ